VGWTGLQVLRQEATSTSLGVLERGCSSEKHVPYFWQLLELLLQGAKASILK